MKWFLLSVAVFLVAIVVFVAIPRPALLWVANSVDVFSGIAQVGDGKTLELGKGDPQLRHLDHAWASTVHAFQGRTVDNVIAAMEVRHPHLTTQKSFYVEVGGRATARSSSPTMRPNSAPSSTPSPESASRRSRVSGRWYERSGRRGVDEAQGAAGKGTRGRQVGAEGPGAEGARTRQGGGDGLRAVKGAGIKGGADVAVEVFADR